MSRDAFLEAMTARASASASTICAIPEHPYYRERFGWLHNDFHNATRIGRQTMTLPLSPKLGEPDVARVIAALRTCIQ